MQLNSTTIETYNKLDEPQKTKSKTMFQRISQSNRTLGIFFGCLGGMILGIVLALKHKQSIAIIGSTQDPFLLIITVLLAMGTGGNLCSYIGSFIDMITGDKTIIDGIRYLIKLLKQRNKKQSDEY